MAYLPKENLASNASIAGRKHGDVGRWEYGFFVDGGEKYVQLNTYAARDIGDKEVPKQIFQMNKATASKLVDDLIKGFELKYGN
ncbi:MAG: hypothetical protein IJ849_01805 [Selenomonadaceae bacterium]|nr:hypothetical protein [Selenomonadaceae bacterium]